MITREELAEIELENLADWISSDLDTLKHRTGCNRIELMIARFIIEGLEERLRAMPDDSQAAWNPFTWSMIFTAREIDAGIINIVPDWFVEGKSPLATDWQTLSQEFTDRIVGEFLNQQTFAIKTYARQSPMANIFRSAGVRVGAKLVHEAKADQFCVITAIGKNAVFGYWSTDAPIVEKRLNLKNANYVVHQ